MPLLRGANATAAGGQTNLLRMGVIAILGGGLFHGLFILILDLPLN